MGKTMNADGTENPSLKFFTPLTKQGLFNVTLRCKRRATGNQGQQVLEGEQCLYPEKNSARGWSDGARTGGGSQGVPGQQTRQPPKNGEGGTDP